MTEAAIAAAVNWRIRMLRACATLASIGWKCGSLPRDRDVSHIRTEASRCNGLSGSGAWSGAGIPGQAAKALPIR
jgi:hypothetical protein